MFSLKFNHFILYKHKFACRVNINQIDYIVESVVIGQNALFFNIKWRCVVLLDCCVGNKFPSRNDVELGKPFTHSTFQLFNQNTSPLTYSITNENWNVYFCKQNFACQNSLIAGCLQFIYIL